MTTTSTSSVRRLAVARLISITGGSAAYIALTFVMYQRTRSPAWVSATLLLTYGVKGAIGPFAGMLGDRFDRRSVMIWSDLAGAACFAAMAFVSEPGPLLALAFASAVVEAPFEAASVAAIPNLVASDRLSWANSLVQMGRFAGISVGPALGGVLLERLGAGGVFGLNAVSFLISSALVVSVRGRFSERAAAGPPGRRRDADEDPTTPDASGVRVGVRFIARDAVLGRLTLAWVVLTLGLGMSMVADVPLAVSFGVGSLGFSAIVAAWGAGSVAGSFLGRFLSPRTESHAIVWGTLLTAVGGGGMALSPVFWPIVAFCLLMGVGNAVSAIADQGVRQRRTPDRLRSRVVAASDAAWQLALAVAFVLAAPALEVLGPQGVYGVGGVAAAGTTLLLLPVLRRDVGPGSVLDAPTTATTSGRPAT